eukprot:6406149-Pyramimonas_sp.AAC.1
MRTRTRLVTPARPRRPPPPGQRRRGSASWSAECWATPRLPGERAVGLRAPRGAVPSTWVPSPFGGAARERE